MRVFRSVQAKVVAVIVLVLGFAVAGAIYLTVNNQRDSFLEETSRSLSVTSTILNDVVRNTMLVGAAPITISTITDLQSTGEFQDITIYRRDGTTAFHDDSTVNAVNRYNDKAAFEPTERVPLRTVDNDDFRQVLRTNSPILVESVENQTAEYYFPILNYAECRVCHGTTEFIRGVAYYRVSTAPIYAQLTQTRNTLTTFFIVAGVVLAGMIIFTLRRIVLRPVLLIGGTVNQVGQGNLDTHLDLRSRDEIGQLATEINGMIVGLKDKNRLEVENRVIEAKNEENRKYLDNINEGLLLLDHDLRISEQYSTFLEELFGTNKISGRSFAEFIYPDDEPQSEQRETLNQFLGIIFDSTTADMEMIASINPLADKRLSVPGAAGPTEIVVDASFQRITDGVRVQNVMVIFVDKTQLVRAEKALETERLRSETEVEQIAAILRSGPDAFQDFAADAERTLKLLDDNVDLAGGPAKIAELFRELHSLKGSARYMELKSFAQSLDDTEELVAAVRDGQLLSGDDTARQLSHKLDELHNGVVSIKSINDRFREFAAHGADSALAAQSVRTFFDNLERMTQSVADELGRSVNVKTSTEFDSLTVLPELRNPIIHLVRNALAHGIEEGLERISNGKPESGLVEISFSREAGNRCRVEVRDDGRGIDFSAVETRARELGLISNPKATSNELLRVLFSPAFSSNENADEISGRGVGLDAVQASVRALGGSISVGTKAGSGTRFTIRVPLKSAGGDE